MIRLSAFVAALAVVVVTACTLGDAPTTEEAPTTTPSSASPTPTPTPTQAPPPSPAPSVGACYRLTFDDALSSTSDDRPVPCRDRHTSQTAYVGELDAVVDGHLLAVDSARVQEQVAAACPGRVATYLGATPRDLRLSMLRPVWFSPTIEQSDRGAAWFRCDVIALAGHERLAPLGPVEGVLSADGDRYAVCGTTKPDAPTFQRVACAGRHTWRAIASYDIPGKVHPGARASQRAGAPVCRVAAERQADDSLDYEWALDWPTQKQWDEGQRWGLCWAPDR